jgi:hypothetical protein
MHPKAPDVTTRYPEAGGPAAEVGYAGVGEDPDWSVQRRDQDPVPCARRGQEIGRCRSGHLPTPSRGIRLSRSSSTDAPADGLAHYKRRTQLGLPPGALSTLMETCMTGIRGTDVLRPTPIAGIASDRQIQNEHAWWPPVRQSSTCDPGLSQRGVDSSGTRGTSPAITENSPRIYPTSERDRTLDQTGCIRWREGQPNAGVHCWRLRVKAGVWRTHRPRRRLI